MRGGLSEAAKALVGELLATDGVHDVWRGYLTVSKGHVLRRKP